MASRFGQFTGNTIGEAAAFAAGIAIAPLLEPIVQELRNQTWSQAPDKPLDPEVVAEALAEKLIDLDTAHKESRLTGLAETPFDILADLALTAPGVSEALTLLRRNAIAPKAAQVSTDQLHLAYRKSKLDEQWWPALDQLATVVLTPAQIALGMVRSVIDDQGLLVRKLDTSDSNIPQYKPYEGDGVAEALASGVDRERLRVLVGEIGLPMAVVAAAQAHFRGIITKGGYYQAVEEGDVRPEWADAYLDYARQIPTAHDFIEGELRDWISTDQRHAGTQLHGMSDADSDLLFLIAGRPLSFHQVFIGMRRGGVYNGPIDELDAPFLKSLRESNIRPEWYNIAWAQRHSYPAPFVLKALAKEGTLSAAETEQVLLFEGWEPGFAKKVSESWAGPSAATPAVSAVSAHANAARAIGRAYTGVNITRDKAEQDLAALGENVANYGDQFTAWDAQRQAKLQGLSNTQIRNAYRKAAISNGEALALLEGHGLPTEQATAYLAGSLAALSDAALKAGVSSGAFTFNEVVGILESRGMTFEQATAFLTS